MLDSGEHFTRSVAVHEGYCLQKSARVVPHGGYQTSKSIERYVNDKLGKKVQSKFALS